MKKHFKSFLHYFAKILYFPEWSHSKNLLNGKKTNFMIPIIQKNDYFFIELVNKYMSLIIRVIYLTC